jgi:hypothetical protein
MKRLIFASFALCAGLFLSSISTAQQVLQSRGTYDAASLVLMPSTSIDTQSPRSAAISMLPLETGSVSTQSDIVNSPASTASATLKRHVPRTVSTMPSKWGVSYVALARYVGPPKKCTGITSVMSRRIGTTSDGFAWSVTS